jgi:hypothetical protein
MSTLIDVLVINKKHCMESTTVAELGLSDHPAQVLPVLSKNLDSINRRILEIQFNKDTVKKIILGDLNIY